MTLQIYTRFLYNVKNSSLEGFFFFFLQLKNFPFSCIEIRRFFFFQRWKSPKDRESLIICMYKYDFPPPRFVLISNSSTVYTELIYISSLFIFSLFLLPQRARSSHFLFNFRPPPNPPPQSYGTP